MNRTVDVKSCQRCGKDHDAMLFMPLSNPIDEYAWWGLCVETGQPVLLCDIVEED